DRAKRFQHSFAKPLRGSIELRLGRRCGEARAAIAAAPESRKRKPNEARMYVRVQGQHAACPWGTKQRTDDGIRITDERLLHLQCVQERVNRFVNERAREGRFVDEREVRVDEGQTPYVCARRN